MTNEARVFFGLPTKGAKFGPMVSSQLSKDTAATALGASTSQLAAATFGSMPHRAAAMPTSVVMTAAKNSLAGYMAGCSVSESHLSERTATPITAPTIARPIHGSDKSAHVLSSGNIAPNTDITAKTIPHNAASMTRSRIDNSSRPIKVTNGRNASAANGTTERAPI